MVGLPSQTCLPPQPLTYAMVLLALTVPVMWLGRSFYSNGFRTLAKGPAHGCLGSLGNIGGLPL